MMAFEAAFARFCGVRRAVGVASGTAAIHLALAALGVGPGDEVVTVAHTFTASAEAVAQAGARPRFVDVDEATGGMDPKALAGAVEARPRSCPSTCTACPSTCPRSWPWPPTRACPWSRTPPRPTGRP